MYPASDWSAYVLRAIMDISARASSLAVPPAQRPAIISVRDRGLPGLGV